ncbi:MAG: hypothetical protein KAU38_05920, partial [Desulfobacterales bacterium]|nr:hypothetical protein [Desulfobacterales bacterium]
LDIRLVIEMILWGGNQHGILDRFLRGLRNIHDYQRLIAHVVDNLDDPRRAFDAALAFLGFGLTYASKLLRFCRPSTYGALDSRIRNTFGEIPPIDDTDPQSMWNGYFAFLNLIHERQQLLEEHGIERPAYDSRPASQCWRASEIEMALFFRAS